MQFHSLKKPDSSLFFLVIISRQACFSQRKMDFFHSHRQRSSFTFFFLDSSLPTSGTTRLDHCFHWKIFPEPSYFRHISPGGYTAPHHFKCGCRKCRAEGQDALLPLVHGWDIPVSNYKARSNAEATTGGGRGWRRTIRRPPEQEGRI